MSLQNVSLILLFAIFNSACYTLSKETSLFLKEDHTLNQIKQPDLILKLINDIKSDQIKNIHALIIIKDDLIITEEYFNDYNRFRLQYSASVTKSFASALLGLAIDKGFFEKELDELLYTKVSILFPKYKDLIEMDDLKNELKLNHLLSMSAGFDWDEETYPYSDNRNDCNRINNSEDPLKFLFNRKLVSKPGKDFKYNGGLSLAISYLIQEATKTDVRTFAKKYLFDSLKINKFRLERLGNGLYDTDGGLHLSAIDQAKLGYLFLNNGIWDGKQIVSREWVLESTRMRILNQNIPDYGFQWWGGDYYAQNNKYSMYLASGHGGQKIVVVPDHKLVVVITQQVFDNRFADINFIAIMSNYILPAVNFQTFEVDKLDNIDLAQYIGRYEGKLSDEVLELRLIANELIGYSNDGQVNKFEPLSETLFKSRIMDLLDIYIQFTNGKDNSIVGIKSNFAFNKKEYLKINKNN